MSKEKQIEKDELQEFVITLSDCQHRYDKECIKAIVTKSPLPKENKFYAKYLMEQGYHKQSEGEWKIKSVIHKLIDDYDEELYVECPFCQRTFWVPYEFDDEKIFKYAREHYPYCNCGAKMKGGAEIPTADVVPKSEVAREIFMDIDRVVEKYSMGDIEDPEFVDIIAELKKKYTEEKL